MLKISFLSSVLYCYETIGCFISILIGWKAEYKFLIEEFLINEVCFSSFHSILCTKLSAPNFQ